MRRAVRGHRDLKAFCAAFHPGRNGALITGVRRDPKAGSIILPRAKPLLDGCCRRWIRSGWKPRCLDWQRQVRGPAPPGQLLAADGRKELRHAQGAPSRHALPTLVGQYYRGSQLVETKSNEIPAVRQLLERVTVAGSLIGD